ncbi:peptidoglycan-binding domain-containing protein, partial [Alkalibacillus haloalkaliphilus]|uniref:peptidoglycan-binding domain-containing protein n=1 Tax=Alkalibacillus haloalkaliphilus TaxID=94136 RepID=UPI0029362E75
YYDTNRTDGVVDEETLTKIEEEYNTAYKRGDRSSEIQDLKLELVDLEYADWEGPSTCLCSETEETIKAFQDNYQLKVTGVLDSITQAKISEVANSPYQLGNSSEEIREIKLDLVDLGFADWEDPAENFGPETHNV